MFGSPLLTRPLRARVPRAALALLCTTAGIARAEDGTLPPPRPAAVRPVNVHPGGPPIPPTAPLERPHPPAIPLWEGGAPGSEAYRELPEAISWRQEPDLVFPVISNVHRPSLTPYLPARSRATGAAVIIAPGGGHMQLTMDREGYDLAEWLADRGIAAFVLKYRLARDGSMPADAPRPYTVDQHAHADGARAIRLVRARAREWNIAAERIGILGFSAGGEVALLTALRHDAGDSDSADPIERVSSRPDFVAAIYPGGLSGRAREISPQQTPPMFLLAAYNDRVTAPLTEFFTALHRVGVSAELHIYSRGGHGFGVRTDRPEFAVSTWHHRFVDWLRDRGFSR